MNQDKSDPILEGVYADGQKSVTDELLIAVNRLRQNAVLRKTLADRDVELSNLQRSLEKVLEERDELQKKLEELMNPPENNSVNV